MILTQGQMEYKVSEDVAELIGGLIYSADPRTAPNAIAYTLRLVPHGQVFRFSKEELQQHAMPSQIWLEWTSEGCVICFYPKPDKAYYAEIDYRDQPKQL